MRIFTKNRKSLLAKIFADIGKIIFAGIVVGQIISDGKFKLSIFLLGNLFSISLFVLAFFTEE